MRCDVVYPVSHRAPVLLPPDRVVELLMTSLSPEERRRGVFSEVARFEGVRSVQIQDEEARVDFEARRPGEQLDDCARETLRAQLLHSLSETFGVERVSVTVAGERL
jgi:hypothetical protein